MGLVLFVVLFWVSLWLLLCVGLLCVGLSCVDVLPPPRSGPLTKCIRSLEKFSAGLGEDDVFLVGWLVGWLVARVVRRVVENPGRYATKSQTS